MDSIFGAFIPVNRLRNVIIFFVVRERKRDSDFVRDLFLILILFEILKFTHRYTRNLESDTES